MEKLAEGFAELFAGLDRACGKYTITRKNETKNKMEGRAVTVLEPVTLELWKKHLAGTQGLGIIPIMDDGKVWWGALDIDRYDMDLVLLEKQCKEMDLPMFLCKTKSGGAHLYVFFEAPASAKIVRSKLAEFSVALGHPGVEIYPKQIALASKNDVGNWLNMPYFGGDDSDRYCIHFGKKLKAQEFLDVAIKHRISEETLKMTVPFSGADFADGPPCLQTLASRGFGEGGRNKALFNIGVYLRNKNPDSWEADLEQQNYQHMKPPLPSREVIALGKSLARKEYAYTCKQDPIASVCNSEVCKNRPYGIKGGDEDIGLVLGSLVKVTSIPPTWIIDVEGYRLEMRTEDLINQDAFRRICVEKINKFPPKVKPHVWEMMIREKLEDVEEIIAPVDATPEGRLEYLFKEFCASYSTAPTRDELLTGNPWYDAPAKTIYFRSPDFIRHLELKHFKELTTREIWAYFRRVGAEHKQFSIKGQNVQCWAVSKELVNLQPLDVPDVGGSATY
jgi:hypothetical protein